MCRRSLLSRQILILLNILSLSLEIQYDFEFEDDQLFTKCLHNPMGLKGVEGLFDMTDLAVEVDEQGTLVSGNVTIVWEVEPTDRIEMRISTLHWERGVWQPTILNVYVADFCKIMYDKNQLWYSLLTQHVTNVEEVRDNCVTHKGTVLVLEQYLVKARFGVGMVLPSGRHRVIITMAAIDLNNITRPNALCYEIIGTFFKI